MGELNPDFERIDGDLMDVHNPETGVVITITPINDDNRFTFRVTKAKNQKTKYQGAFNTLHDAENQVKKLSNE